MKVQDERLFRTTTVDIGKSYRAVRSIVTTDMWLSIVVSIRMVQPLHYIRFLLFRCGTDQFATVFSSLNKEQPQQLCRIEWLWQIVDGVTTSRDFNASVSRV